MSRSTVSAWSGGRPPGRPAEAGPGTSSGQMWSSSDRICPEVGDGSTEPAGGHLANGLAPAWVAELQAVLQRWRGDPPQPLG